jgi:hypothetical protein
MEDGLKTKPPVEALERCGFGKITSTLLAKGLSGLFVGVCRHPSIHYNCILAYLSYQTIDILLHQQLGPERPPSSAPCT